MISVQISHFFVAKIFQKCYHFVKIYYWLYFDKRAGLKIYRTALMIIRVLIHFDYD